MKTRIVLLLLMLILPGCGALSKSPGAQIITASEAYTVTMDTLADLKAAGKFSPAEDEIIILAATQAQSYLSQWKTAYYAGEDWKTQRELFRTTLRTLQIYYSSKGGD